jgi:hypothetical protein
MMTYDQISIGIYHKAKILKIKWECLVNVRMCMNLKDDLRDRVSKLS